MLAEFTSKKLAILHTYLMKTMHKKLPITVHKKIYNKNYPDILCLMCDDVEFSEYAFTYFVDALVYFEVVSDCANLWKFLADNCLSALSLIVCTLL
ncbi:hypothetical protein G9A89_007042 [Geosiphon pyriformis]|nr:hypothetical protein G9A89_007042 [Geosiphon pyriformis]